MGKRASVCIFLHSVTVAARCQSGPIVEQCFTSSDIFLVYTTGVASTSAHSTYGSEQDRHTRPYVQRPQLVVSSHDTQ